MIVYRHIRLDKNEPFYIGIGKDEKRAYDKTNSRNFIWKGIIKKSEYRVEILFEDLSIKDAKNKEIELIALYGKKINKTGTLANLSDGGDLSRLGTKHTSETKIKMSNKATGRISPNKGKTFPKGVTGRAKGFKHSNERLAQLKTQSIGKKWYTDGNIENKDWFGIPGEQPLNYKPGRTFNKNKLKL